MDSCKWNVSFVNAFFILYLCYVVQFIREVFLTFSRRLFVLMKLRPENLAAVAVWLGHISKNHPDVFETA